MALVSPVAAEELPLVRAAQEGDERAFTALVDRHRPALHAHCYRMLASPYDADEAVQEAVLRAWKGLPSFRGAGSVRTWLFRIATRAAIDVARGRSRRELPVGASPPAAAGESPGPADNEVAWMGPYSSYGAPETSFLEREALEVAYVAALQHLGVQQRAVFLLREVLRYSAAEVAEMLGTTVAGVNSRLQRARAELRKRRPLVSQQAELARLGDAGVRDLASRYARAIEEGDVRSILDLLTEDASWSMPPLRSWFKGHDAVGQFLASSVFPERWRHQIVQANGGQLAVAGWILDAGVDSFVPAAIDVLELREGKIAAVTGFLTGAGAGGEPDGLFARFGLAEQLAM